MDRDYGSRTAPSSDFGLKSILGLCGLLLVVVGVGLLLYFAFLVFSIFDAPENVRIVQMIAEMTEIEGPILEGRFIIPLEDGAGTVQNANFEVEMSPELRTIIFLFISAFALIICVNIVRIIIVAGSAMIKAAGPESGISIQSGSRK